MLDIVPYDYRPCSFVDIDKNINCKGYLVTLYLIFDGTTTYTFFHQLEWLDNVAFIQEVDIRNVDIFTKVIFVSSTRFPHIFNDIELYEHNVSSSKTD